MDRKTTLLAFQRCMVSNFIPWTKKGIYKNKEGGIFHKN